MGLHPFHAQIRASCAQDWHVISPDEGRLASGLEVNFYANPDRGKWVVKGRLQPLELWQYVANFYTLHDKICIEDLPTSFFGKVQLLQSLLQYDHILRLHQWLQILLIEAGEQGTWLITSDAEISIESMEDDRQLPVVQLPIPLAKALQALARRDVPSFGLSLSCQRGRFYCDVPASHHARLEILAAWNERVFMA